MNPQIAQCILLESGERVCIIKTIWLKIIQRKWKKIYKERRKIISKRNEPSMLLLREITGKWTKECRNLPSLNGMLKNI
jgi:hypothetical protein